MKIIPVIDERELLKRLKNGDICAFDIIYNRYADLLVVKLNKLVKIDAVVEEIHQDVFLRLWNVRANLNENVNLRAYILTIARNLVIDFYRKASRNKNLERQLALHIELSYDHIEPLLSSKETHDILEQLISLLPPQRQKVFRMIKIEGKSYQEASEYFGVSISTVKDHMAKSISFLRQQLSKSHPHITFGVMAYLLFF